MATELEQQDYYYFDYDAYNEYTYGIKLPIEYNNNSVFMSIEVRPPRHKHYCQLYTIIDTPGCSGLHYSEHILTNLTAEDLTHLKLLGLPINKVRTPAYKEAIINSIKNGFYYHDFD